MTTTLQALRAGATPESDKASHRTRVQGLEDQRQDTNPDCAAVEADRKELSRLRAQLALRGHYVHRTAPTTGSARFIVTRGAWLVELADLPSLRAFVWRVGGAR